MCYNCYVNSRNRRLCRKNPKPYIGGRKMKGNETLQVGDRIYVINSIKGEACVSEARIVDINPVRVAVVVNDTLKPYRTFPMRKKNKLFFTAEETAQNALEKLPKIGSCLFVTRKREVVKKTIVGYAMIRPDGKENLEIIFSTGPSILLEDFGRIAFLSKTRQ